MRFDSLPRLLIALGIAAALAACGELPRPFQPEDKIDNRLLALPDSLGVVVRPIDGLPEPMAAALAEAVAESLRHENVPATTKQGNAGSFIVDGTTMVGPNGVPTARFVLLDPRGTPVKEQLVPLDKSVQTSQGVDFTATARTAATAFAAALQPAAVAPPARPTVRIGAVTGAPGQGGVTLARALDYALRHTGVKMAATENDESLVVSGHVTIVSKSPKLRAIDIVWTVLAPDGTELGKVEQANEVPSDFVDHAWGELASAVAEGAAEGITDLIDRAPAAKPAQKAAR